MRFFHCASQVAWLFLVSHVGAAAPAALMADSPPVLFTFPDVLKPVDAEGHHFLRNADSSMIGCTDRPATKTGHVYLFLTRKSGDTLIMRDLNARFAELFGRRLPRGFEGECVILERIEGRILVLWSSVYLARLPPVEFRVRVSKEGALSLVRR